MTNNMRKFMVFAIALAMASPAALGFGESEAFAAPGDLIKSSNDGGRRTHKQARKRTTKKSDKKKKTTSRTTTRTTTRGTTTRRVPGTTTRRTISRDEARRRGATTTTTRTRTRTPERTTTRTRTRYGRDGGTTTNRTTTRTDRGRTTTTTTTRRRSDDRYDRGRTTTTRTRDRYDRGRPTTTTRRDRDRYGNTTTVTRTRDRYDRGRTTTTRDRYDRGRTTTTTRRTTVYRDTPATTVRVERTYREPVRRTTVVTRPASRTTVVNHHHHHNNGPSSGASTGTVQRAPAAAPVQQDSLVDGYITASVGATGMAIPVVSDQPLPGIDYQVGVGGKSGWLAAELGFNLAGYRLDPNAAESDLTMVGLTADVKLQPSFGFVEPYVVAGVGGHVLTDHYVDSSSSGASLRLGGGVDFRIENVALSAQYLRTGYGLANDGGYTASNGEVNATTETVGLGLKFYF